MDSHQKRPSKHHGTGPILAQYRWRYWPNTASQYRPGTVLHTVFALARYRFTVSARYGANTGPIPGQYRFLCTGPVLAQYRISGIGPVLAQYWNSLSVLAQYSPDTGPVPICLYWPSIGPIPHIRYWPSTDPILGRYRASTDLFVLALYWTSTGPILGQ